MDETLSGTQLFGPAWIECVSFSLIDVRSVTVKPVVSLPTQFFLLISDNVDMWTMWCFWLAKTNQPNGQAGG